MYQNFLIIYQIFLKFFLEWENFLTIFHCLFKIIFFLQIGYFVCFLW